MRFLMHGLDDADLQLGKFIDNLCYLTIHCREIGSRAEERLGRLNLTLQDAQRILSLPDPYGVCHDMAAEEEEEEEEEDTNEPDDATQVRRVLLKASRRFIRLTLARTSVNKKALRFRVRGYGPKGDEPSPLNLTINVEDSRVASLRDSDEPLYDETDDPPDEPAPAAGRPKPNAAPTVAPLPSQHDPSGIKGHRAGHARAESVLRRLRAPPPGLLGAQPEHQRRDAPSPEPRAVTVAQAGRRPGRGRA